MKKKTLTFLLLVMMSISLVPAAWGGPIGLTARPKGGDINTYEISLDSQVVMRYRSIPNYSAWERSRIIIDRISVFARQGELLPSAIHAGEIDGMPVVLVNDKLLATVTEVDWQANNSTSTGLVQVWAENIQKSLGNVTSTGAGSSADIVQREQPAETNNASNLNGTLAQDEAQMLSLVNAARKEAGVAPLQMDSELVKLARMKSRDMIAKGYFAHQSPTYGSPFDMMREYGVEFGYAGENLAGAPNVGTAHKNLMNSPGHRANILNTNFTHIGIGIIDGGPYGKMYTQMFISKR
ncbi:CAP domain-containing protein [Metallumcola ferriviriculae]|uniref:CAP domain-containing protein n=1 Tax=Metallumcola ferriviriculae TaxID=3039180 RepID=A0AAU0UJD7_9FIRM|nr:CAP domain-containing protein [Desulfitibacteraceae bacterium MK1]